MNKIQVQSRLSPEVYEQLQAYMTQQGLSEIMAIEAILISYLADKSLDELTGRVFKLEQELSYLKRQLLAVRFRA